jgi:hypothetical protein
MKKKTIEEAVIGLTHLLKDDPKFFIQEPKQQTATAVEWLYQEIINFYGLVSIYNSKKEILEKAKEMEEEQTIDFAKDWWGDDSDLSAKEYYKQTFNK